MRYYDWFIEKVRRRKLLLLFLHVLLYTTASASDSINVTTPSIDKYFKYNGAINLSGDYLNNSNKSNLQNDSRILIPELSGRGSLYLNLTLFNQVQLPFEVWFSTREIGYQQPFNQFGVNPKIGSWLTLHAGYFFSKLSDFTFGDVRMLGGGVELHPGNFRFTALYGRIQQERTPDSNSSFPGLYNRRALALKIGYGNEGSFLAHLNVTKAWDERDSAFNYPNALAPKENLVTSLNIGFPISRFFKLTAEGAISVFTDDKSAPKYAGDIPPFVDNIMPLRYSTMADAAFKSSVFITPIKNYSLRLNAVWVGPGFYTLGYANMPNDILDLTAAPSVRLLNGNLTFKGSIGFRYNNLRDNKISDTRRVIGSMDMFTQFTKNISINAQYSNYGMRTAFHRDTMHFQNVSQVISLSPNINFEMLNASNTVSLMYSYQDVNDINTFDNTDKRYMTHTGNISWSLLFPNSLNLMTSIFYNDNRSEFPTKVFSVSETVGYSFFESKLIVSGTLGYTDIRVFQSDKQLSARASVTYTMDKYGALSFNFSNMNYMSGAQALYGTSQSFNELQGSLQYRLAF